MSLTVCHHLHICTATSSLSRCKICQEEIFNALRKKFSLLSKVNIFPIVDKSKHTRDEWKIILTLFSQVLFAPISCASVHNFDQYRPSNSLALLLLSVAQGRASERVYVDQRSEVRFLNEDFNNFICSTLVTR